MCDNSYPASDSSKRRFVPQPREACGGVLYIVQPVVGQWAPSIFTARCYASAVLAMALCLSVRPSQVGVLLKRLNESSWFWHVSFLPPILHCVKRKFGYLKNNGTSLWNFVLNSGLRKFRHGISIEKGGRSERDKLGHRRSTKSIILLSPDARPL